jgi:hypothetical protein
VNGVEWDVGGIEGWVRWKGLRGLTYGDDARGERVSGVWVE